jgi:hypothetical protein
MSDRAEWAPSAFRLNLEQQKNRAKDLLRAAKAADPAALSRLAAGATQVLKLADAQLAIARELRFASWAKLKAHIEAMDRQRAVMDGHHPAADGELTTLHIRCGSDIQQPLRDAGFVGDFLEHAIPYCMGPVTTGPDRHELMARFIVDAFPSARGGLVYERELEGLSRGDQELQRTADRYARVVLWSEHDVWDQLFLARLLAHYAQAERPRVLELIVVNEFPGSERFIGLGQLPPEALRLLWPTRKSVTAAQLSLGNDVWMALASDNPQRLAVLARTGTPTVPIMAPALHRHPLIRTPPAAGQRWFSQHLAISAAGLAVLRGQRDWHSLRPPARWVGGVHVQSGRPGWRWDEARQEAIQHEPSRS